VTTYNVTLPIAGHVYVTVEADSEEEAIERALETAADSKELEWETLRHFNRGNVCYCPTPWDAAAEEE
jgi:acyl-CoA reductase-like NAD-dependent aldehyde dehydrogenase